MVFAVRPRKYQRRHGNPPTSKTSINDCPAELLLPIVEQLDTQSILNLKLACKHALPVCNTTIADRYKTLYLYPSKNALSMAMEICHHPIISRNIEQLVLLGKPMLGEIGVALPSPARSYNRDASESKGHIRFHSWPSSVEPLQKAKLKGNQEPRETVHAADGETGFAEAYKPLIEALRKLPKLYSIAFSESTAKEYADASLNRVAKNTVAAHTHKISRFYRRPHVVNGPRYRRSDAEVLVGLFHQLPFTSFAIESQLAFIDSTVQRATVLGRLHGTNPFCAVTRLHLALDVGWADQKITRAYRDIVDAASTALQSLRLSFIRNASTEFNQERVYRRAMEVGGCLSKIFPEALQLPNLQKLDIDYPRLAVLGDLTQRPLCLAFDPLSLLFRLRETLSSLSIRNVVFSYYDVQAVFHKFAIEYNLPLVNAGVWGNAAQSSHITTQVILNLLGEAKHFPKLKYVMWEISHFRHHVKCRDKSTRNPLLDFSGGYCSNYHCGQYDDLDSQIPSGGTKFEELTERLGLEVDEERQVWDFGETIMPAIRQEKQDAEI